MDTRLLQVPAPEAGEPPEMTRPSPWPEVGGDPASPPAHWPPAEGSLRGEPLAGPFQGLPAGVLERRLIRRAEALWEECRAGGGLPPATALAAFSSPGVAGQALLFARTGAGGPGQPVLRQRRAGRALAALIASGVRVGDPPEPLLRRLEALAERALALRAPAELELEPGAGSADLLLRAIALPFAAVSRTGEEGNGPGDGPGSGAAHLPEAVLVIASWRQLLSAEETRALHQELAQAIERLRHGG